MRRSSLLGLLALGVLTAGCGSGRLSDTDITRLCALLARCTGLDEASCEANTRAARDTANAEGCGPQLGAAARCAIRANTCDTAPACVDENESLDACQSRTEIDSGFRPLDGGPPDVTRSEIRIDDVGMIELYRDGEWRPICDDGFGMAEADVACRHLGFSGAESFSTITGPTDTFWLDDVSCDGTEAWLDQCSHSPWGTDNCSESETQAVFCF